MRRFFATVAIAAIGTTVVGTGIALAADLEVTPEAPAEGEAELTITVADFSPDTPIYAVPCTVPAEGEDLDVTTDTCDIAEVVTATTDADGKATIVVNWVIPAEGVAVYVGDEARDSQATTILLPATDATESDAPEVAVLGTTVVQEDQPDELADTGARETMLLLMVAALAIGLGVALRSAEPAHTPG